MAAAGICGLCLLYAANRAFKTSAVSRTRVQPSWFDTRYKFGFGAGNRSIPSANVKARLEWTANVTSSTNEEENIFNVTGERLKLDPREL